MAIPGMQAYTLKCESCGWEDIRVKKKSYGLNNLLEKVLNDFPKKCPECGEKITITKNDEIIF